MNQYTQQKFVGERALFQSRDLELSYCTFADGESPLKESKNLKIENCLFQWKYPLWYCRNVEVKHSTMFEMARAGIWYTDHISMEDMIPRENTIIAMTNLGYIKRMTVDNFKAQNRGGRGIKGMQTIEEDFIADLLMTTTHHYVMFFTNFGRVYRLKAYEIPEAGRTARGTAIINLLQLAPEEKISAIIPVKDYEKDDNLFMVTRKGIVKKTPILEYSNVRKNGLAAINLREDDELIEVKVTNADSEIFLVTRDGMCIRFKETDVRNTGRTSMGVIGMTLSDNDEIVGMQLDHQGDSLLIVSENGMGKRTSMDEFTVQHRGGKGIKAMQLTDKTGLLAALMLVREEEDVMMISDETPLPSDTPVEKSEGRYTVKGLLGKQVLYTARQEGRVLTLDAPDDNATFRTTIQDMKALMNQGVSTLVLTTEKGSTTLNLSLLCEGQTDTQRVVLRQLGDSAFLTVGLRCRRDLIVGR